MNFQFFTTRKPKKFNYKPRFYNLENENKESGNDKNSDEFSSRLHDAWRQRRKKKESHAFPLKTVIWISLIVLTLLYFYYKFFMQ